MPNIEFSEREVDIVANNIEKSNISLVQRAASMLKSLNAERGEVKKQLKKALDRVAALETINSELKSQIDTHA